MSTATVDRPLRTVWTPQDAEEVHQVLQAEKGEWRRFLTAKGLLLGYLKATSSVVTKAFHRLHLDGAARMIRRAVGWLFGGFALVRRGLSTAGVRPGIAWLLTTSLVQGLVKKMGIAVSNVVAKAAGTVKRAFSWCLRLFGNRGRRLASTIDMKVETVRVWITKHLKPVLTAAGALLSPSGLPMQTVGTLAKGRALSAVLTHWLPRPWNILARVLANLAVVPASIRREAIRLLTGISNGSTLPVVEGPDEDPTPPEPTAEAGTAADVVDLEQERAKHFQQEEERALASLERYPAKKRSSTAKRKR